MNEKQTATVTRPTKKQRELLQFIEEFIQQHGYSPSYREIMNGLHYNSVATVALHVGNLIKRGHLIKRDRSARSLEVVARTETMTMAIHTNEVKPADERWLVDKVEQAIAELESLGDELITTNTDHVYVLVGALKVLGLDAAATSFIPRLSALKTRQES